MAESDHGALFDRFTSQASNSHGGSYFDTGFGQDVMADAHGRLFDLFGVPKDSAAHGERFDDFGWREMPAVHGQYFDSDFKTPEAGGEHGSTWFDVFRGGRTQARVIVGGKDVEGTVISVERDHAIVKSNDGQTHEVGLSQFLAFRTPNEQQAGPAMPMSDAEAPSARNADAHGGGERTAVPTDMPSPVGEAPQGGHVQARDTRMPAGLMDTFTALKALAADPDVAKTFPSTPVSNAGAQLGHVEQTGPGEHHAFAAPNHYLGKFGSHDEAANHIKAFSGVAIAKSVDTTATAVQGAPGAGQTVGHRSNCPEGGSAPCGADVDGHCTKCGKAVKDHEAVGKAFGAAGENGGQTVTISTYNVGENDRQATGDPPDVKVPQRDHKTSDHHMDLGAQPNRCPHCGKVMDEIDHQTNQGQASRQQKQGSAAEFTTTTAHKCAGSGLDILKSVLS